MKLKRTLQGFGWGVLATILMSTIMIVGVLTGMSPMPKPIPVAIVHTALGDRLSEPLRLLIAVTSHLCYGGVWGAAMANMVRPVTVWSGVGLGLFLWVLMQVAVLPLIGWGPFGFQVTPAVAVATLLLHTVYGFSFGWLMDRRQANVEKHSYG